MLKKSFSPISNMSADVFCIIKNFKKRRKMAYLAISQTDIEDKAKPVLAIVKR